MEYAAEYFTCADSLFDTGSFLLMFYVDIIPFPGGFWGNSFNRLVNEGEGIGVRGQGLGVRGQEAAV